MFRNSRWVCSWLALLIVATLPASAATVVLRFVDDRGDTARPTRVWLRQVSTAPGSTRADQDTAPTAIPDPFGAVTFDAVAPGVYEVGVGRFEDRFIVPPGLDTVDGLLRFTVDATPGRIELTTTVVRGDRYLIGARVEIGNIATCRLNLNEEATGALLSLDPCVSARATKELLLPPGRWRPSVVPAPGVIFVAFEINGKPVPVERAELLVTRGGTQVHLNVVLTQPCRVEGHVRWDRGVRPPATLIAELIDPGEHARRALAVGTELVRSFALGVNEIGEVRGLLLDGVWRITPQGDQLAQSDPPFVELSLSVGQVGSVEFTLRAKESETNDEAQRSLEVTVTGPGGRRLVDAVVEVYRANDAEDPKATPLSSARTGYNGEVRFAALPRGALTVVAGHIELAETVATAPDAETEDQPPPCCLTLELSPGSRLDVALDTKQPVATRGGFVLDVEEIALVQPSRIRDEKFLEVRKHRRGRTDATGRLQLGGFAAGRYRLAARPPLALQAETMVQVSLSHDEPARVTEWTAGEAVTAATLTPLAAAGIRAQLSCSDGSPPPLLVEARLLPIGEGAAWRHALPIGELAEATALDPVRLFGPNLDQLRVGPLEPGVYALAIRPQGFARWSFAGGTEDPRGAVTLTLREGREVKLGYWMIDCDPSLLVVAEPVGPNALPPDLSQTEVDLSLRSADPQDLTPFAQPVVKPLLTALRIHGLPRRKLRLDLRVSDRLWLPSPLQVLTASKFETMKRGAEERLTIRWEAPAGSIDLVSTAPVALALDARGKKSWARRDPVRGIVGFGPLVPGDYELRICDDDACTRPRDVKSKLNVRAGEIHEVSEERRSSNN